MAAISLFWDTNMAAVTSCENTLYHVGDYCIQLFKLTLSDESMKLKDKTESLRGIFYE